MIHIKEIEKHRLCNACLSDKNTMRISIETGSGQTLSIALCEQCFYELVKKGKQYLDGVV